MEDLEDVGTPEDFTAALGALLDRAVRRAGSAAALARAAGIAENSIANWRAGAIPQAGPLDELLSACRVPPERARLWQQARTRAAQARNARRADEPRHGGRLGGSHLLAGFAGPPAWIAIFGRDPLRVYVGTATGEEAVADLETGDRLPDTSWTDRRAAAQRQVGERGYVQVDRDGSIAVWVTLPDGNGKVEIRSPWVDERDYETITCTAIVQPGDTLTPIAYSSDRTCRAFAIGSTLFVYRGHALGDARSPYAHGVPNPHNSYPSSRPEQISHVIVAPDGDLIVTVSEVSGVDLWDPTSLRVVGKPFRVPGRVEAVELSPDATTLAVASGGAVHLFDPYSLRDRHGRPLDGHTGDVRLMRFSPDGTLLATSSVHGGVRLWDPTTGRPLADRLAHDPDTILRFAFAPDGTRFAVAEAVGIRVHTLHPRT
ncbi:WD40 repeat domain-containing protein [Embleya sp. NPDC059237]|uniref:WD40 repeat domain-containing protein n=1 Tax=Embleya sp. NPDC059237 TaxID=3346784 RepID=UPI00367F5570